MVINVKVRVLGVFRGPFGRSQLLVKMEETMSVRKMIQKLAESLPLELRHVLIDPELNDPRPNALILVNGKEINVLAGLETEVDEGDEIVIVPVSHGG